MVVGEAHLERIEDLPRARALISPELGIPEDTLNDCLTALTEAVANALTHGRRNGSPFCRVLVEVEAGEVRITVEDRGSGFHWGGLGLDMPPWDAVHGRGVPLIRSLMDSVAIRSTSDGTRIHMRKRVAAA